MSDDSLNARLVAAAEKTVGKKAITSKFGVDCFALPDTLLRNLGAKTAADGDIPVTAKADYDWGDELTSIESVKPGDIVQFKDHRVFVEDWKYANGTWYKAEESWQTRPHHSAIVVEVKEDGSVVVVEQNVKPDPKKVSRNVIARLDAGDETRVVSGNEKIKIKVTGQFHAYHPVLKPPKGASLLHQGRFAPDNVLRPHGGAQFPAVGARALAHFAPTHGGAKRHTGPVGTEIRSLFSVDDFMRDA